MAVKINGSTGITFEDNDKQNWGTGNDLQIYHDGSHSRIVDAGTGVLALQGTTGVNILNTDASESMVTCTADGSVDIYYDNAKKFETTSTGAKVSSDSTTYLQVVGGEGGSACLTLTPDEGDDNADEVRLITNDGGATYLQNKASGSWETNLLSQPNGNIELYYDNAKKFETTSAGVTITGDLTVTGSAPSGGVTSDAQKNTVAGTNAGDSFSGTDATDNTLIGYDAGTAITDGDFNVAIGAYALDSNTEGSDNVAIGLRALDANTTGNANVAVGFKALYESISTTRNVAVGWGAAEASKDSDITAIGYETLHANRFGARNTACGSKALITCYDADDNTALGYRACNNNAAGNKNTVIGSHAGYNTTSDENTFVGYQAGQGNTSGYYNTCMGHNSGYNLSTGTNIMLLGFNAGTSASPSGVVDDDSNVICLGNSSVTDLYCNDTSISSSDQRDKTDITNFTAGLSFIKQLRPVTYRWDKRAWYVEDSKVTQAQIDNGDFDQEQLDNPIPATKDDFLAATPDGSKKDPKQHIGFLAQEVLAVEQSAGFASDRNNMLTVNLTKDETQYGMKYERLVPILVNAIKELETRIATLEGS